MMRSIYPNAMAVTVWLGLSTDDSNHPMDIVATGLTDTMNVYHDIHPALMLKDINAMINLSQRNYWTRAWIIQELDAGFYGGCITFRCGNKLVSYNKLQSSLQEYLINARARWLDTEMYEKTWAVQNSRMCSVLSSIRVHNSYTYDTSLATLLSFHRDANSEDPRDKMYAVLNMASEFTKVGVPPSLRPNYEKMLRNWRGM